MSDQGQPNQEQTERQGTDEGQRAAKGLSGGAEVDIPPVLNLGNSQPSGGERPQGTPQAATATTTSPPAEGGD